MAQVTTPLNDTLAEVMCLTVKTKNMSQSYYEQALQSEWSFDVAILAGTWHDFPMLDEIRMPIIADSVREAL